MAKRFEGERKINQERPDLLDIVKIDGRWAQVRAGGEVLVVLDTGEARDIDWSEYKLKRVFNQSVKTTMALGENFTDEEVGRIHWGGGGGRASRT